MIVVVAAAMATTGCARQSALPPPPHVVIRLITGTPGGGVLQLAEGLASVYRQSLPNITVETFSSPGAVANIEAILRNHADLGFVFADVTYTAFVGRLGEAAAPDDSIRAIAALQATAVHLVVRPNSPIRTVSDLRGRRVGVGPPGSGTALTAELVLGAFGIALPEVRAEALSFDDAARHIVDGTLDAMFDDAIYPTDAIRMATQAGARLMPLTGPPIDQLRHDYPFFRPAIIPRDSYPDMTQATRTIGVDSILVCRRDLDDALVYELTRFFFQALPTLSFSQDALRSMDLEQAPATPIPLHAGAARYYRERELMR